MTTSAASACGIPDTTSALRLGYSLGGAAAIAVFFTSLLPQFVGTDGATAARLLLLGALFNVMGLAWLSAYALAVVRARDVLGRPRVRRFINRVTGLVLIGLGIRLVFDHRR